MPMGQRSGIVIVILLLSLAFASPAFDIADLSHLDSGRVYAPNALWMENPIELTFGHSREVTVADLKGPAEITMIHFAMPATLALGREAILRIFWDDEESPSVECPLVDFFCDPAGQYDQVNTCLVNKRRGFNCYFPMPFRKHAVVQLVYDGDLPPGPDLISKMPCYSYVMVRTKTEIPEDSGYFHASWRQEALPLGLREYLALDAVGKGKFIGWNVTVRRPGSAGYPVDMNEKFFIDGEKQASVELQGIEDSFGFSWGFPPSDNVFPLTGYMKFFKGAAAYRFFLNDSISFSRSLRVTIGFGENEHPMFREVFGKETNPLQLSSTVYWYQKEPHHPLPPLPPVSERKPAPDDNPLWPFEEVLPATSELQSRSVRFLMHCGRPQKEVLYAEPGYSLTEVDGYSYDGWPPPVYHCRANARTLRIALAVPANVSGMLRLFMIDPDHFGGGRNQKVRVDGKEFETLSEFYEGKWIEIPITEKESADGRLEISAENLKADSNAVVSQVEFIGK